MGIFDRFRKSGTPEAIDAAMAVQGMDQSAAMGPGRPLNPNKGYSQPPRSMDYPTGVNLSTRSRTAWGRTSFETLREMTSLYDVARMCINHKIDEIRSMGLLFMPADGVTTDVRDALDAARTVLAFPDREHPFDEWLGMWLENQLRYDAGPLYFRRNLLGEIVGLEVLDGTTIAPYIDEHGRRPMAPAPAYFQLVHGQVWSTYTAEDILYPRFRPQGDSPYGLAPIESILLTANTDLKFQWHLLQMFTDGSVPSGFIELPPDISSPDQVAEWQDYWDAVVQGDQAKQHQLVAVPAGTKVTQTRPKGFDPLFPDYLVTRVAAAFGVVPQDLGLLKDVNRSTGDVQVDIQFRVNTLPWVRFVEQILNRYLQHDLGLPVKVALDTGRDKEDRLTEAQAWEVYVKTGAASMDEMRQELLGLPIDNQRPIPRGIITARTGFVPLTSILAISGPIDGETGAPDDSVPLSLAPFDGVGGVLPDKLPGGVEFKRAPQNPDEPMFPSLEHIVPGSDVVNGMPAVGGAISKEMTAGVTAGTGIHGNPLDDDDELVKAELAQFRRFVKQRKKSGEWRDFAFNSVTPDEAQRMNREGRESGPFLVKAQSDVSVSGLAVHAADTGRVLMLQRALDDTDPASGKWEFPGGHLEDGESPVTAALREWSEEVRIPAPAGDPVEGWLNGHYQGFVLEVPTEFPIHEDRGSVTNPDDPDGDCIEAIAWWSPSDLVDNPVVRQELHDSLGDILPSIGGSLPLAKAGWRDTPEATPQLRYDLKITDAYQPVVLAALKTLVLSVDISSFPIQKGADDTDPLAALLGQNLSTAELEQAIRNIIADGYMAGVSAAGEQIGSGAVTVSGSIGNAVAATDWSTWVPGSPGAAAQTADGALADLLAQSGVTIKGISDSLLEQVGNALADGLAAGSPSRDIADVLAGLGDSLSGRAEMIAHTEGARAMTAASFEVYGLNGVTDWDLITSAGACPICLQVEAANPHSQSDTSNAPPLHPRCRCSSSPVVESINAAQIQYTE
ncbi:phage portal protein [Subtercola vilae]|uniref:Phage portal protein n=1 Tax=Subtercola vilae TaxID=2056433 RepID=A0A4T2BYN3_9MICO|nr:phage portal protein [Subtercola vilae]TIH34966.1 phage portal protein [Subtercola vilae]